MDPNNSIEVKNVSKSFKIEIEDKNKKATILNKLPTKTIENRVIDNISVNIKKGEVIGIIGRNGSGKSTFLSLIAKIMEPDSGTIERSGKMASILELGMGFHPDMSGRENIYLKGELYGFSKNEIDKKIDRIIEYSGIGQYIDNPVRTYSSGMSGRLAFSILINIESDIMLVDEVLSVGDSSFSSKAELHFKKLAARKKTIIIVSHNISTLETLCSRVIWIENGKIKKDGPAKTICAEYQNAMNESPEIIIDLAIAGVPESQYKLAIMYRDGYIVDQNDELYYKWLESAAKLGHTKAQVMYADYLLRENNVSLALDYYRQSAEKGDNEARTKLSNLHSGKNDETTNLIELFKQITAPGDAMNEYRYADLLLKTAWNEEDKKQSFDLFKQSAEHGYPYAMHQIGIMYRDGIGTPRDISKMEESLVQAANHGFMPSITILADLYSQGRVLPKNEKKAFDYAKQGSELGNTGLMYRLATYYRDGVGVEKNEEESRVWFKKYSAAALFQHKSWIMPYLRSSASTDHDLYWSILQSTTINCQSAFLTECDYNNISGANVEYCFEQLVKLAKASNTDAMHRVGDRYYRGIGVTKNIELAFEWYLKGASLGDSWCRNRVGEFLRDGKGTDIDLTKSVFYFKLASKQGNINAISNLLSLVTMGFIEDSSLFEELINMLKTMSLSGNIEAIRKLGNIYFNGINTVRNYETALYWYKQATLFGDSWSANRVGEMYRDGKGTPVNCLKARDYFLKAIEWGNIESINSLIYMVVSGMIDDSNLIQIAFKQLQQMCNSGDISALRKMGDYYNGGVGTKKDCLKAMEFYKTAARLGDPWSRIKVAEMYRDGRGVISDLNEASRWFNS